MTCFFCQAEDLMVPESLSQFLNHCERKLTNWQQLQISGYMELYCSASQGRYRVDFLCGECYCFFLNHQDLEMWNGCILSRQREPIMTIEKAVGLLNSAILEAFWVHQGHAHIAVRYRLSDQTYGIRFEPSIIAGGFNPGWRI